MKLKGHYSSREVAAETGLTARQLQWWDARGIFASSVPTHKTPAGGYTERRYTPIELIELKVLADLRRRGVSVARIRRLLTALRTRFKVRLFDAVEEGGAVTLFVDGTDIYARTAAGEYFNLLENPRQPLLVLGHGADAASPDRARSERPAERRASSGAPRSRPDRDARMTARQSTGRRARVADWALATVVVVTTAVVSTWPLVTSPWLVPEHQDPLFSSWRLYQSARNLSSGPWSLFDGNIFYPAADVTLYSDPIALPVVLSAPFVWAGVPAMLLYSALFWVCALSAGLAMFACARAVSGSRWGGLVAAAMFVGAPLRLEHVMHLEMLFTAFLPLTVLATMRAFDGHPRAPWAVGALLAGQFLCGIYAGVFLLTAWPVLAGVEWLRRRGKVPRVALWRLAGGLCSCRNRKAFSDRSGTARRADISQGYGGAHGCHGCYQESQPS